MYADQITPRLSPAYDIVTTNVYIHGETKYALNLGKTKEWYTVTMRHFKIWAEALKELPMDEAHKATLREHWKNLQDDFRIEATEELRYLYK